jgi:hypothetical protein
MFFTMERRIREHFVKISTTLNSSEILSHAWLVVRKHLSGGAIQMMQRR